MRSDHDPEILVAGKDIPYDHILPTRQKPLSFRSLKYILRSFGGSGSEPLPMPILVPASKRKHTFNIFDGNNRLSAARAKNKSLPVLVTKPGDSLPISDMSREMTGPIIKQVGMLRQTAKKKGYISLSSLLNTSRHNK